MTPSLRDAVEAFKGVYQQKLAERPQDIRPVDEMDEMIHAARAEMGQSAMAATVQGAVGLGLSAEQLCDCGRKMERHHRPELRVQSMQGKHEAKGVSYRCDRCKRTERPVHQRLGIGSYSKTTTLFDRLSADFFLDKGAPTAVRRLKEHHGVEPGRTTVLVHAESRGEQARQFLDNKLKAAAEAAEARRGKRPKVDTGFVQMDSSSGKTVRPLCRPQVAEDVPVQRTAVRKLLKVKRPIEGRQVKLLCAQAQGDADWIYDAYVGDYDDAPRRLEGLAAQRGWQPGVLAVMTADGDDKIREAGEGAFLPDFQFILDRPHAITHLRHVPAHAKDVVTATPEQWVTQSLSLLDQGKARDVVSQVRSIAESVEEPKAKTKVENVATYFSQRADAVHYDAFRDNGWPLASGAVEGGHIHFIHPITKRGAGWLVDNLNRTVALACIRQSGWWDEFWQWAGNTQDSPAGYG